MPDDTAARILDRLDAALLGLRRLWAAPPQVADPDLGAIEMSTIWVVDALDRNEAGRASVAHLAAALDVAHSTSSRLVDRAETAGMVARHRSDSDARSVHVALTPAGKALAERARDYRHQYLAGVLADWPISDRDRLADLVARFAAGIHVHPPQEGIHS